MVNHPFSDSNKCTGALAMLLFLELNQYEFHQADEEIEIIFVDLAAGVINQGNFFGWVANHAWPCPTNTERTPRTR